MPASKPITPSTVRADFNDAIAVVHYTRAAHELGLWASEQQLIEEYFPDRTAHLLEAGCGAGRVAVALWALGYRHLRGFDFAGELVAQARSLAQERGARIEFREADATRFVTDGHYAGERFDGALFMFNGLMQIPRRRRRRQALRQLARACRPGAPLLFTTHDRNSSPTEQALWRLEAGRWERGEQDPRLQEFGDRYFEEAGTGRTFMHLPDRAEILDDLAATGWEHVQDAMRRDVAREPREVREFSDECRFWIARRA